MRAGEGKGEGVEGKGLREGGWVGKSERGRE